MLKTSLQGIGTIFRNIGDSPETGMEKIREAGFECVDFNFEMYGDYDTFAAVDGSCFYDRTLNELKEYFKPCREAAERYGLTFGQAHAPFIDYPEGNEEGYEHFVEITKKVIALAGWMKIPYLVIHPFTFRDAAKKKEEKKVNLQFFCSLIDAAKEADVVICLENLFLMKNGKARDGACSEPGEALEYLHILNANEEKRIFGFCFDAGHAALLGRNIYEFVTRLGDNLRAVHLHDNDGIADLHGIPYTYAGSWGGKPVTDWEGLIKALHKIGYSGTVNFETGSALYCVPEELTDAARRFTHEIGVYLADRIEKG
ncbi:MAG: sugar phosphate isomerase/epimerase [Lachnospiraceae bacterium]|nr:sugar phosphate isomerase/epimerase [Lachnospiraceae bacterium]